MKKIGLDKGDNFVSNLEKISIVAVLFIILIAALLFIQAPQKNPSIAKIDYFSSYDDLVDYFSKASYYNYPNYYRGGVMDMINAPIMAKATSASEGIGQSYVDSATDFSKTNIQVEGVDEADIIKSDGKYIYAIAQGKLFIVNAYPAENAKIISTIDLNNSVPIEMFISNDSTRLLVFSNSFDSYSTPDYGEPSPIGGTTEEMVTSIARRPWFSYTNILEARLYNISDKSNPIIEKRIEFEGSYLTSRLIGNNAYFVINSNPRFYTMRTDSNGSEENGIIPLMRIDGVKSPVSKSTEIGILPMTRPSSFVTIASLNLLTQELEKETVTASAQNVYASQDNLYFVDNYWDYQTRDENSVIPQEVIGLVKSVYYPIIGSVDKTVINKFELNNGKISFVDSGVVPGRILNQFSMDEYNGNFRIATTVQQNWSDPNSQSKNNIYVLDKTMKLTGSIEGIAPGELIYSARFMGDKGYLVTFKTVDPLFVIDLSDPANPKILGKLKIPGYSDYMQPIDETHILGIGKDVNELEDAEKIHTPGAVYYTAIKGVKMAIFDVSDVENPIELHKVVIGDRGTDSEALRDHKALLLDKEKELLVLPINLVEIPKEGTKERDYLWGENTFQGAFVYNISLENGFTQRGRITHISDEEKLKSGYYYDYSSQIRRSLYMDNVLYTFSDKEIKANSLDTLNPISEVIFPQTNNNFNETPIPIDISQGIE